MTGTGTLDPRPCTLGPADAVAAAVGKANELALVAAANPRTAYTMPAPKEAQAAIAVPLTQRGFDVQIRPHLSAPQTLCRVTIQRRR